MSKLLLIEKKKKEEEEMPELPDLKYIYVCVCVCVCVCVYTYISVIQNGALLSSGIHFDIE